MSSSAEGTEIPALNLFNKNKSEEEHYIPSIEVNFAPSDTSADDARAMEMIKRADKLMSRASKVLNS